MKRVLLTGPGGFLGRHVLPQLLSAGYEVHAVDRVTIAHPHVTFHLADLLSPGAVDAVVDAVRPTHLLHLAWYVEHGKFWNSPENVRWVDASFHLLRHFATHGGRRVVTSGTCAEYQWGAPICREDHTPCVPSTLYGAAKHALQLIQSVFCREAGISSAWGRIFYLYGPGEPPARLVPSVILSLLNGEPALCTHGLQIRDFLHVEDVARAFVAILDSDIEGPINIGSGHPVAQKQFVETIGSLMHRPDLIRLGARPPAAGDPERLVPDTARLQSTGFAPHHTIETGLADTIAWWHSQKERRARKENGHVILGGQS